MAGLDQIRIDIDKETQCNFYVKDCVSKSCQTCESKKAVSGKGGQSKKMKLHNKEINVDSDDYIGKITLWINKLKDSDEINQNVTLLEKTSLTSKMRYLEIFRKDIFIPELGSEPVKFLVNDSGDATMYTVFDGPVVQGNLYENEELREAVALSFFKPIFEEGYTFCAGVSSEAKEKLSSLPYVPKNISVYSQPYTRSSSKMCAVWFKSPKNMPKKFEKSVPQCKPCRDVSRHVRTLGIQRNEEAYASPSSKCALKYLSSSTISMRKSTSRVQKHRLIEANQKLREKCEQLKTELASKQSKGMDDMTKLINKQYKQDLDILFS